ncbi:hypothetical protein, partial [Actinotignum timonense]
PDYVDLVEAMGGQCITIGRGGVSLNPLDTGNTAAAAEDLPKPGSPRTNIEGLEIMPALNHEIGSKQTGERLPPFSHCPNG